MPWPLMLVEDVPTENSETIFCSFEQCGKSEPYPVESKPFSKEDFMDLWDRITNWAVPHKTDWLCPKCKSDVVTTINGKGRCFGCSSHWRVRPALTLVKGK